MQGKITTFYVLAKCPNCEEETEVHQSELRAEVACCQHCAEEFEIALDE
ncbi:hypothetical protein ABZP26_08295 [Pseudoalteromonas sp. SD03]|uniref:CPXCG motif-containing cysteine-rich protein n=1 Tax=Pseudoalteromonas sp. SD03 TaxID=3231719 RepID=A0AB39AKV6_9GAMM|tara:strand:- start:1542 stop:1688 length:147 start_codon:yes stop_codon:yes gene_type:complete